MKKITVLFLCILGGLNQIDAQSITASGNRCVESNLSFTLQASVVPESYDWDFGDGTSSSEANPVHQYTIAETYSVQLIYITGGASTTLSLNLIIKENPDAGFTISDVKYTSYSRLFIDTTSSQNLPLSYCWYFNDESDSLSTATTEVTHKFPAAGEYDVLLTVTDNNSCSDTALRSVTISDLFVVPNVFTPNNDGVNDNFIVTSNGVTRFSIEIFNRWGNRVFRRNNVEQIVWDGFNPEGSKVSPGTYFYVITPVEGDTVYEPLNGYLTIFY